MQLALKHHQESLAQQTIVAFSDVRHLALPLPDPDLPRAKRLQTEASSRFKIRLASSEGHRSSASYLIQKMYSWRGYRTAPLRSLEPDRITLIACDDDNVVGTISVGLDHPDNGLLVEELYSNEVAILRAAGARLCEFTKLAVDRSQQSKELLAMLFHIAYIYARRLSGYTDLLIEVNPRHVRFYERMLGFKQFGPERINHRVHAPAVLMRLNLDHPEKQIALYGGQREAAADKRSLYPFFFAPREEKGISERLLRMG